MLLTSWIRALRQSFTRHRLSRARRKQVDARRKLKSSHQLHLAEILEERSLLSIKPLVIDINALTSTNVFTSTASTPGINITNSLLDPNNDGISDYDDLLIGASQSSTFESTIISGAGIGIRINLSNLTGLNHIAIDNVFITAGANQQGISITLDNVALQSLAIDQTNVTPAATGTGGTGLDINLKNMASTTGVDVSIQNSNIRSGSTSLNGVNVTLESVSRATHLGELTLSDSTVEGFSVSTSANSTLYATLDQASVRNSRIQDGAANPNARGITYTLNRTVVNDLRIEDNLRLRNVAVTTTNSPLRTVSISDNTNFSVGGFAATDAIRDAIRINATSTNAVGTQRSDVTNLRIVNNTITGSLANANAVNGIVLSLNDSNLGDYATSYAGARIAGNTISNLSGTVNSPAAAISVTATATATFVANNGGRPVLLDFDGDGTANDTNGITQNLLSNNNGRGIVVTGQPDTSFLADITANSVLGGSAVNRREGVLINVAVRPTLLTADSFSLNFSDNTIDRSQGSAVSLTMQDSAVGSFVIQNNEITNATAFPFASTITATTPNGLSVVLEGANTSQEAANILRSSVIQNNFIGVTRPTAANPTGTPGQNSANGIFINTQEASVVQDLQILNNSIRNNGTADTNAGLQFLREDKSVLMATSVGERAVTISGNTFGQNRNGIILDGRNGSIDLLDFSIENNFIGVDSTGTDIGNTGDGILLRAQADARMLVDITDNQIRFNEGNGINLDDVFVSFTTDKRQIGGTWLRNTVSDNTANGILVQGRHGLFDEATSIATPLLIGVEGQGNILQNNGRNGIRVARNDARPATGQMGITDNLILQNGLSGIFARSPDERMAIRSNQIEANSGKGIDLEGFGPFGGVLPGRFDASIRDNVVTSQVNGVERGDGVEITLFNPTNAAGTAVMSVLATNNFIDSNAGRGVELLNLGSGAMQVHFGDGTLQGRNTVVGNLEEGFYIVNSTDVTQPQDATATTPGTTNGVTSNGNALFTPDMMLNIDRNLIQDNGLGLVNLGAGAGGSGLVLRAGSASATGFAFGGGENSFASTYAGEVGANNGDPSSGNGRINMRVTNNQFEGNFGNDFVVDPYISNNQNDANFQTQGSWDSGVPIFQINRIEHDPLVRVNLVFTGNSGNGIDVTRFNAVTSALQSANAIPGYSNNEANFKSRTNNHSPGPGGPFGSGTRLRSIIRLGGDGTPVAPTVGFSFIYPNFDPSFASTLRVESGFDRSGTTAGFPFYNPTAPGPGSEDNFDDNDNWSIVPLGTFSYPDVNSPTQLTADVVDFTTPRSTTPSVVQIDFTEYVRNVDIGDFRLLRNGVAVPLESAPGVPLAVVPVLSSEDPNHPGAFRSFTIDLSVPANVTGNYELQVLAVDGSNPLFSPIEDVVTQLSGQGNTLTRVVNGNGVLQDYTVNHLFTIDSTAPSATVGPITPDPRNSAAGIVTINFNEDVTGVDIADFELYRNDGVTTQPVILGSISVTQISASQYTLNLNQLTGAPGTYELRLVSTDTNTPIQDLAGNLVADNVAPGIASSDTWLVDTTLPFVTSIADSLLTTSVASPVNAHPGSVIINFSEAVSGLDNSDFTLLRTNTNGTVSKIDISSSITFPLFQLAANQYELNLLALASTAGTYSLSINPLNSGIVDTAGNAFLTSFSESWVLDIAAPLADIVDVAPDPRQTPVDALNTIFTEKVNGVNLADASAQYVLAFDDGTSATSGSISDSTNAGPIVVTSTSHGLANGDRITIYGVVGNTNTNGVFTVQNVTTNTFELTGSIGSGIYTGGGRWVRTVSLAGLTISQQTDTRYVLNLSSKTLNQGTYIVSLLADGTITDDAGNPVGAATGQFNVAAQDIWTNGPDAAPTGTITPITTPRGTNAGIITVTFSEPLQKISGNSPVDFKDFRLTRGATTISLASVPIKQIGPTTYTLDLSATGLTDVDGTYTLQLLNTDTSGASATPLRDMTGNLLSDDSDPLTAAGIASQITWVKDATLSGPQVTSFRDVQRNNTLGSITKLREVQTLEINFTDDVQGIDLTDASKNFLLTRQATGGVPIPVSLDGIAVQQVTAKQYRITLSTLTGTDGTYRFTVLANGLIKNATTLVDLKNPQTVTWTKDGVMRPTTVGDSTDSNQGNEVVGSGSNYSLRQAIQEANALAGDDVIELGAGTYTLSLAGVQEDLAAVGDLDIRQNLVIRGKGVGVTIIDATALMNQVTATNRDRIFQILAGVTVTIQGVTIQKGAVTGSEDGGAIRNAGTLTILDSLIQNNTSQDDAGAINNTGTLTIDRTTISGNTAVATGGAIRNAGTLTINNSTLSNNLTTGSSGFGGALMNVASFTATLENVTVSTNTAQNAAGGGIRNDGTLRLINDTIAFNRSLTAGAGLSRNLGTVTIGNTIVSDNTLTNAAATASDVAGAFVSIGGNLVRTVGTATGFNVALGDQLNVNPNLQPLGSNGGPTQTHALLFNSPAIDRGLNANVTNQNVNSSLDQRGALRFLDGPAAGINAVDVGAVEFGTFFVNTTDDSPDVSALVGVADGLAEDGLRQTSLRAAIMESNLLAGESAIMLDGQIYSLKRLAPDTVAPTVASITGVPLAPITTGGVGVVTITFSERVAGFDLAHINFTRNGVPVALPATTFQLTKVSDLVYRIENKADIANGVTNTGLTSVTQTNGLYSLTINSTANVSVNGVLTPTNIRDIENNTLDATNANVNWVRGTDTFAPSVTITPATITNQFITNAGSVTVTFSEKVTGVSANNFSLTRNGVAVTGLVVTPTTDNNFAGRTVVTLNLQTLTALNGAYVLTFNPTVGTNITVKDSANNNLPAGTISRAWTKVEALRFEPINNPRVDEVTKVRLQFTERVAGVKLEDFTLTFDDGSGIGPQPVDLTQATLATVGAVTAVPGFGNAAEQWELTFSNKQAARDGVYSLSFDGLTNGNLLVTTATTAINTVQFTQTATTLAFTIGEDQSRIGDLDIISTAGRVRIFGKGKDTSTTVLGTTQARTVIDGNLTDRLFDLDVGTDVSISGVEMINGRVVYERSGGAFRNFGSLTLNDDDLLTSFADGNGGAIYNAAPFGQRVAVTNTLQQAALATDNVLTLTNVASFPITTPFVILVDSEQIQVTAVNAATNQLTVSRGFNGTTAAAHAANTTVTLLSLTTINRSNLQSNLAGSATSGSQFGKGGAIYNENGAVTINEGTYSANAAVTDGGAIYNGNQATASLLSTTFTGNLSGRDGGAIYNNDTAILSIRSSTLSNNRADATVNGVTSDTNGDGGAIYNETSATLLLDDSLLQNNIARNGGALYNDDGTLVLNRDTFGVNSALENGGAIFNTSGGSLTLNQGLFTTNSASNNGGAIQNFGRLVVQNVAGTGTQFLSNESGNNGGAIFNQDGVVDVSSATFTLNRSLGDAGVIFNGGDGTLTIARSTFDRNSADGNGGALVNDDFAQITIDEVTFSNNSADGDGGAIYNNSEFTSGSILSLTIDDTTLNNNSADRGGAIFNTSFGGLTLTNSTLSANTAVTNGGGLTNFGTASLLNDTLYLNDVAVGGEGAGIANNIGGVPPFGVTTLKNTLVAGGSNAADLADGAIAFGGSSFLDGGHNLIGNIGAVTAFGIVAVPANGNLVGDSLTPLNPQLDTLRDNGGPTLTHALLFGSPARDAGDNFAVTLNDQRGLNRVFDGDGNGVATVDIGAFESGFVVNSFLDTVDENPGDGINADSSGRSTLRAAIMEANARPGEDTIILGPGIFTLTLNGRSEDFRLNSAGNIASSSETGDLDILDDLNIIGAGTDLTFINAALIDRLFQVFPNVNLKLSNLTLENGNATSTDFGGAIFNQGATTLDNVVVINSSAGRGGGVYNDTTGTLTVVDSLFRGNQAVQQGGAIYNDGSLTLTLTDIGAASRLSAAVTAAATTITVDDVSEFPTSGPFVIQVDAERMLVTSVLGREFTVTRGYNGTVAASHSVSAFATLGNTANVHGGGLFNLGVAEITQSSFNGNLAQSRGGGLYNAAVTGSLTAAINAVQTVYTLTSVAGLPTTGTFTIQVESEKMTVTNVNAATNTITVTRGVAGTIAAAHAGGTLATSFGLNQTTIQQSTFLDNFASSRGAAIYNEEDLTIKNSTLSNNDSGTNAALGNSVSGRVTIENSTVVDNVAYRGGGLSNSLIGTVTVHNTIVANNASTSISGVKAPNVRGTFLTAGNNFIGNNADSTGFVNNTNSDQVGSGTSPFDPVLKSISNNGGPTLTHSARTGSPILDTGNNTGGDPFDQRGAIRPTNADSDIGSVEQQVVHVTINDVSVREGNSGSTIMTFTLSLDQPSIQEIRVAYSLQGDTAFAGEDFLDATGEVVFAPNQLNQTLEVIINGDTTIEPDEQFLVNLSIPADATFTPILDRTQAVGTIRSDDTGFRITNVNKVERETGSAAQDYVFTVSVVGANLSPGQVVSVDYSIVDGSATIAGGDYALVGAATGTLTFTAGPNGELPAGQTITVQVLGDEIVEANENFFVNLASVDLPFEFDKSSGVGTIFNDDLSFTISDATANEGDPVSTVPMNFTVTLDRAVYVSGVNGVPTLATTTVTVATASASATSGQDFNAVNTVLTFSGNTTSQVVSVGIIGDLRYEVPSETFQLQVTAGTINGVSDSNVVGFSTAGTGTIVDNDPPPDQYHIYTRFDTGLGMIRGRVDRIDSGVRTNLLDYDPATAPPFTQLGDFGGIATDDLFAVDFNLYDDSNDFTQYDSTGVIDLTHVLGIGNPIPAGGLSVDGLNQVGADAVRFQGGGTFSTVIYNSINSGSGSVSFDGSIVNYAGLEPLFDYTAADNRVFNAPVGASNDTINASASGGFISISGPTFESVTALAPTTSLTLNGDGGNDTFLINSSDLAFTAGLTVNAGDGNDNVNLSGWALVSTVNGGAGNDTITGGSNADVIDAGDGNDTITGGLGNDTLFGGVGNDSIAAGGGDDFVDGGDDNDTIQGNDGIDTITGGAGNDSVDGGAGSETVDGGTGDDTVAGGDGDDTVLGNDGNDVINGGAGNDSLDGGFGDDTMSGDAGNDTVNGQNGSDIFLYSDTSSSNLNFTLTATLFTVGAESDTLINTERANITAGSGNNQIDASTFTGSVTMNGGGGNDTLFGGLGDDSLIGGLGNDTASGGSGNDTINGGDGNDTLSGDAGDDVITGDAGADSISGGAGNDNASGGTGNDVLTGASGIDTLDGGDNNDTISGGDDGDSLLGGAGLDSIHGDNGDDTIDAGDGDDTAFGDNGNDFVGGGSGNDTLQGNLGDDSVNGMDGNDTLDGNVGFDTLFGGSGDDSMISIEGNDLLDGQGGSKDTFTFEGDATIGDVFTITRAGNGNPLETPTGIGLARLNAGMSFTTIILGTELFTLNMNGGNDLVTFGDLNGVLDLTVLNISGGDGDDTIDGALSTSTTVSIKASMGLGNDSVQGGAGADTIQGDAGNDTIIANEGADSIVGGDGNDSLNGNNGVDTINGGLGDDSIWGGASGDSLIGLDGKDTIWGQGGNDTIDGGVGDDFLDGGYGNTSTTGSGNDSIRGGYGNDKIAGRDGADTLFGDDGDDTMTGGADNDRIDGGNGNDLAEGDDGNDTINGGAGNDFLLGGTGNDSILGGAGNDTLVGEAGNDTLDGQGGTDTVLGGNGTGTDTHSAGDKRIGEKINELFKITTARPSIFSELNF